VEPLPSVRDIIKSDSELGAGLKAPALVQSTNASSIETAISLRHSHCTTSRCGLTHDYVYLEIFRDIEVNYHVALKLRRPAVGTAADRTKDLLTVASERDDQMSETMIKNRNLPNCKRPA
jgi:hypothetical protein